ncbi:Maf family protein [Mycolicibacterium sp. XJ1819]
MTRLVLGSASPGRRAVLRQAGIDPLVLVSGVDEDAVLASLGPGPAPAAATAALAAAKAERVAEALDAATADDAAVIGCDSMLYRGEQLLGKPDSADSARAGWRLMSGTAAQLHTGHCLLRLRGGQAVYRGTETTVTTVRFGTPTAEEIDAYIASGEPLRVAGGFTIDGLGGWFVDGVDGDPSAVVGIGLPAVRRLLRAAGLTIPALWAANPVD